MVFCSKCGTVNHSGKFCSKCGAVLDQTAMSRETAVNAGIMQPAKGGGTSPKAGGGAVALSVSPTASPASPSRPLASNNQPASDASSSARPGTARQRMTGEVSYWGDSKRTHLIWVLTFACATASIVAVVAPQWYLFTKAAGSPDVNNQPAHRGLWDWQTSYFVNDDCEPNRAASPTYPYMHSKSVCQEMYSVRAFAALSIIAGFLSMYFLHFHHRFRALLCIVVQAVFSLIAYSVADQAFKHTLYDFSRTNTVGFILIVFGWVMSVITVVTTVFSLFNVCLLTGYVAHFLFCIACAHAEWIAVFPNGISREVFYLGPFGVSQQYDSDGGGNGVPPINTTEMLIAQGTGVGTFVALCIASSFMYSRFRHLAHYFYSSAALACLVCWAFSIDLFKASGSNLGLSFWVYVLMTLPLAGLIYIVHPDYNTYMVEHLPADQRSQYGNNPQAASV